MVTIDSLKEISSALSDATTAEPYDLLFSNNTAR